MKNRFTVSLKFALAFLFLGLLAGTASAATYVVTKTTDSNDGVCDADCSLREAVDKANQTGAADVITFDATVFAGQSIIKPDFGPDHARR